MNIKFASGKEINAPFGIIGLDDKGVVFGGYDSRLFDRSYSDAFDDEPNLSPDEQIELADLMLERWRLFKECAQVVKTQNAE